MIKLSTLRNLATPKPGKMATRLPTRFAKTNAKLCAELNSKGLLK